MGFGVYNIIDTKMDSQQLEVVGSPFISRVEFDRPLSFFRGVTGVQEGCLNYYSSVK